MIRFEVGHFQIERLALRPYRFELGILGANLPRQLQPSDQPAITLDQMVGEIPGQRDPEHWADNQMGAPPQFA